jgi:hypothetical protein
MGRSAAAAVRRRAAPHAAERWATARLGPLCRGQPRPLGVAATRRRGGQARTHVASSVRGSRWNSPQAAPRSVRRRVRCPSRRSSWQGAHGMGWSAAAPVRRHAAPRAAEWWPTAQLGPLRRGWPRPWVLPRQGGNGARRQAVQTCRLIRPAPRRISPQAAARGVRTRVRCPSLLSSWRGRLVPSARAPIRC